MMAPLGPRTDTERTKPSTLETMQALTTATHTAALALVAHAEALPVRGARASTYRAVAASWEDTRSTAERILGASPGSLEYVPAPRSVLGSSLKTRKAEAADAALVAVSYLAPGSLLAQVAGVPASGFTVCPLARLNGCEAPCLGGDDSNGHLAHKRGSARMAQLGRTILLLAAPDMFAAALHEDILRHAARAKRTGVEAFVRLDGTSDIGLAWKCGVADAYGRLGVHFYDYTKLPGRAMAPENRGRVVFSATPRSIKAARMVLRAGGTVAAVAPTRDTEEARHIVAGHFPEHVTVNGDASEPLTPPAVGTVRSLSLKVSARSWGEHATGSLVFPA